MKRFGQLLPLSMLLSVGSGCTSGSDRPRPEAPQRPSQRAGIPQQLPLDEGLQKIIALYDKRHRESQLYCLEYEKLAYDSLQLSLYAAGNYVPIIEHCRPNFYAETGGKLVLVATGAEFITPGSYYRDTYREAFYRIVTAKVLGKSYSPTQYDSLGLTYGNYDPPVWRIILSIRGNPPHRVYSVTDSFAIRARNLPPSSIQFIAPNAQLGVSR